MAAQTKKTQTKRKSSPKKRGTQTKKNARSGDGKVFWSTLLFITGILIAAFTLITGENVWLFVHNTLLGAFGVAVAVIPFVFIYISVMIALDKGKNAVVGKLFQGILLVLIVCAAAEIFSAGEINKSLAFSRIVTDLIEDGRSFRGGGLFSAVFGIPLLMFCGKVGATVIIILAALFFVLLLANKTIVDVLRVIRNIVLSIRDSRPEYVPVQDYVPKNPPPQKKKREMQKFTAQNGQQQEIPLPAHVRQDRNDRRKKQDVRPQPQQIAVDIPSQTVPNSDVPVNIADSVRDKFNIDIPINGGKHTAAAMPTNFADDSDDFAAQTQREVDMYQEQLREEQANRKKKLSINDLPFGLGSFFGESDEDSYVDTETGEIIEHGYDEGGDAPVSEEHGYEDIPDDTDEVIEDSDPTVPDVTAPAAAMAAAASTAAATASAAAASVTTTPRASSLADIIANAAQIAKHRENEHTSAPVSEHSDRRALKMSSLASSKIGDDEDLDLPETTAQDIQDEIAENEVEVIEYTIPPMELLKLSANELNVDQAQQEMQENAGILLKTLESFGIAAEIVNINRGPSVTRYELLPKAGIKLSKIRSLSDDIALRLAAMGGIRIEAPIPGKAAVGIEVPNRIKDVVTLRDVLDSKEFGENRSKLTFAVGKNIDGEIILGDIATLPHIIIAGTTGSGKSVCTNGIIMSILYNATPEEVRLVLVDPKMVEFKIYNGIPHLLLPVVTDPRKAAGALAWAVQEMLKRYKLFSDLNVRNLQDYNDLAAHRDDLDTIPRIVIVIDELADLMMAAKSEVEDSICRLAQMARAAGMHLIIATQRPTVDVVTGLIKSNIPSRIALRVASGVDSRTILDEVGAEKLLGNGDMLYFPTGFAKPLRVQNCYTSSKEIASVVDFIRNGSGNVIYDEDIIKAVEENVPQVKGDKPLPADNGKTYDGSDEEKTELAIECAVDAGNAGVSVTYLQKKLKLGYARASRIMDELEDMGVVGPPEGAKGRRVLMTPEMFMEYKLHRAEQQQETTTDE